MFNQGVGPCDAVEIEVHFDPLCLSPVVERFTTSQHVCALDEFITCSANALSTVAAANTLTWYNCPPGARNCMGCAPQTAQTGVCTADIVNPNSQGMEASCDTVMNTCAYLVVHNDKQCQSYAGLHTPVCNSCLSMSSNGVVSYFFLTCSQTTQALTLSLGCNADCSSCTYPNKVTHPYLSCQPSYFNSSISLFNRGLYDCATATVTHYSTSSCSTGTSTGTSIFARDVCNNPTPIIAQRVECVNSSNPIPPAPPQGNSSPSGSDAGTGIGIAVGVIGAAAIAGFVVMKLKSSRTRFSLDEAAMNDATRPAASGYGAVQ
jgi:hypothetical protein